MKNLLLAALFLCPARLLAWGEQRHVVILAVPVEEFSQWQEMAGLLASWPDLKLTLALTPKMLTPEARAALVPLTKSGRVELAMRIPGDPLLPMLRKYPAAPGLQNLLPRLALAREQFRPILGQSVPGFVPGAGAVTGNVSSVFAAMAVPWVAVGWPSVPAATAHEAAEGQAARRPSYLPFTAVRSVGRPPTLDDLNEAADWLISPAPMPWTASSSMRPAAWSRPAPPDGAAGALAATPFQVLADCGRIDASSRARHTRRISV